MIQGSFRSISRHLFTVAAAAAFLLVSVAPGLSAQSTRRPRRESTANRKLRIQHTIEETYGHRWEAAGGGGYLRFRSGPALRQSNEISFWADTMYSFSPKLGALATVTGSYGRAPIGNITPGGVSLRYNPQISEYNFLVGPSYRFVQAEKYAVSGFVQGGVGLGKFDGDSLGIPAASIGVWQGTYSGAFAVGASLDYNFDPSLAVRVTPMYLANTFGSTIENGKALNVGIVYRFGRIR